jgi:mRNA deadenylase 3'-5' endonuclease subunit Ccr4
MSDRFRLMTQNILADVWCIATYYPNLPDPGRQLASSRRRPTLYQNIRRAGPDLVCLQEVQVGRQAAASPTTSS